MNEHMKEHRANLVEYHVDGNILQRRFTIMDDEHMLRFMSSGMMIRAEEIVVEDFLRRHSELLDEITLNNLALDYPEIWDAAHNLMFSELQIEIENEEGE